MFNSKLPDVGVSIFSQMSELANQLSAINLSQGFPEFDTPNFLKSQITHYVQHGDLVQLYRHITNANALCLILAFLSTFRLVRVVTRIPPPTFFLLLDFRFYILVYLFTAFRAAANLPNSLLLSPPLFPFLSFPFLFLLSLFLSFFHLCLYF